MKVTVESMKDVKIVPYEPESGVPLKWTKPPGYFQNWRDFPPSILSSAQGYHAIKKPCEPTWWDKKIESGDGSPGYIFSMVDGAYIFEGWSTEQMAKATGVPPPYRTIAITLHQSGIVVAEMNRRMIKFLDGTEFKIRIRPGIPFIRPIQYQFIDEMEVLQFRVARNGLIWSCPTVKTRYLIPLICAERYLREIIALEAPGG